MHCWIDTQYIIYCIPFLFEFPQVSPCYKDKILSIKGCEADPKPGQKRLNTRVRVHFRDADEDTVNTHSCGTSAQTDVTAWGPQVNTNINSHLNFTLFLWPITYFKNNATVYLDTLHLVLVCTKFCIEHK